MFPFVGIMADSEATRQANPSGSYPTAQFDGTDSLSIAEEIVGQSAIGFMFWIYPTAYNSYILRGSDTNFYLELLVDGKIKFSMPTQSATTQVLTCDCR